MIYGFYAKNWRCVGHADHALGNITEHFFGVRKFWRFLLKNGGFSLILVRYKNRCRSSGRVRCTRTTRRGVFWRCFFAAFSLFYAVLCCLTLLLRCFCAVLCLFMLFLRCFHAVFNAKNEWFMKWSHGRLQERHGRGVVRVKMTKYSLKTRNCVLKMTNFAATSRQSWPH